MSVPSHSGLIFLAFRHRFQDTVLHCQRGTTQSSSVVSFCSHLHPLHLSCKYVVWRSPDPRSAIFYCAMVWRQEVELSTSDCCARCISVHSLVSLSPAPVFTHTCTVTVQVYLCGVATWAVCACVRVCVHVSEGWSRGKEIHVNVCMYVMYNLFCSVHSVHSIGLHIVLLYTP